MAARRVLRLHFPDGDVVTEPLTRTAAANGLPATPANGRALVDTWEANGDLTRRPDGGYDVVHKRPRPDLERAAQACPGRATNPDLITAAREATP